MRHKVHSGLYSVVGVTWIMPAYSAFPSVIIELLFPSYCDSHWLREGYMKTNNTQFLPLRGIQSGSLFHKEIREIGVSPKIVLECLGNTLGPQCYHPLVHQYPFCPCAFMLSRFSHVQLFATLWTIACQASLSKGFSRQEYWRGLPCPAPGDLPDPGIEPKSPAL